MMVNSPAIITEVFPVNERGRALGINGITWALGGIAGPILGGLILAAGNWRWIFYINVPIGIIGTLWGYRALHEMSKPKQGERFDPLGAATFSLGLVALLVALTLGIQFKWTSLPILSLFALFVVMFILFFSCGSGGQRTRCSISRSFKTVSIIFRCCRRCSNRWRCLPSTF